MSYPSACHYNHIVTPTTIPHKHPISERTQARSTSEPRAVATLTTARQHSLK